MGDIANKLRELNVNDEDYITLKYTEGADIWHIDEGHVETALAETNTVAQMASLLVSGVSISHAGGGGDILVEMREEGLLDNYERGSWEFEEYLSEQLVSSIYDGEHCIEYNTTQYDYKRGRCDISLEVSVRAGDILAADAASEGRFENFSVNSLFKGFDVSIKTPNGTLTLN